MSFLIEYTFGILAALFISCILHTITATKVYKAYNIYTINKAKIKYAICVGIPCGMLIICFILIMFWGIVCKSIPSALIVWIYVAIYSITAVSSIVLFSILFYNDKKIEKSKHKKINKLIYMLKLLLSFVFGTFEYLLAKYFKNFESLNVTEKLKKDIRKDLLIKFNHANIFVSTSILLAFIGVFNIYKLIADPWNVEYIFRVFASLIIVRTLGRSLEIIYAFFKDSINSSKKMSSLLNADRLKLAIYSFFELIILFTGIYLVLSQNSYYSLYSYSGGRGSYFIVGYQQIIIAIVNSFKTGTVVGAEFPLSGDSLVNNTFIKDAVWSLFTIIQVITNIVLTLFSIAKYSVDDDK